MMKTLKKIKKKKINLKIIVFGLVALSLIIGSVMVFTPTQGAGRLYFRFEIPTNSDGTTVSYSPDFYGRYDKTPKDVTVLYQNDKERYGYAYTTDKWIPKGSVSVTQSTAESVVSAARDVAGVYFGSKMVDRYLPEVKIESKEVTVKEGVATLYDKTKTTEPIGQIEQKKAVLCPVCGEFVMWDYDGLTESRQILTCKNGHRFVTATYEKVEALAK
jgi:hypothetical protein